MKLKDAMNLKPGQLAKLSPSELEAATAAVTRAANTRLTKLEKAKLAKESPSYQYVMKSGGKFSAKNLDKIGLAMEYTKAKIFLKTKTSTVKGTQDYIDKRDLGTHKFFVKYHIADDYLYWSKSKKKEFWRLFDVKEVHQAISDNYGEYTVSNEAEALRLAVDLFDKYTSRDPDIFGGFYRGHMKGATKAYRNALTGIIEVHHIMRAEADAKVEEERRALLDGKYGEKM